MSVAVAFRPPGVTCRRSETKNERPDGFRFPVPPPHPTPTPVAWGAVVVSFFFYAVVVRAEDSTTTTSTTTTSTTTTATTTTAGGSVVALATGKTRSYWPMADRFRSFFFLLSFRCRIGRKKKNSVKSVSHGDRWRGRRAGRGNHRRESIGNKNTTIEASRQKNNPVPDAVPTRNENPVRQN